MENPDGTLPLDAIDQLSFHHVVRRRSDKVGGQ